ncbi:MAG: DEAD/DEAH box helicase, partial [Chloroflexi bacterium]|nr:DEAD/DEAH box helicase [Chloroflexota bacterium]
MQLSEFVEYLKSKRDYRQQIVHVERIPARAARYASLKRPLPEVLHEALRQAGVDKLYLHQAEAINAIRDGQNVIVATSTASGKTLVYNVPVLESILADGRSRALYLFPTKALAQDQL